jgi:uncharacterized protein YqjF (DUF2071 family)
VVSASAEQHVAVPLLRASWETLTFVHWPVPPERVQALLPHELTADVFEGSAWVSFAPFVMANMRPLGVPDLARAPRLRDLTSSPETNLRTYVRGPDGRDGLWFLTLDIGSALLAAAMRGAVGAPYHAARLTVDREADTYTYTGSRVKGTEAYRLEVHAGDSVADSDLQVWLTGRWRAYTAHLGRLLVTPVEHEPWPLREARVRVFEQNLTDSVGLPPLPEPVTTTFTCGVRRVRIGRPRVVS